MIDYLHAKHENYNTHHEFSFKGEPPLFQVRLVVVSLYPPLIISSSL